MSKWTRPASVPIPTIWSTFEGRNVIGGKRRTYWIQDVTDEYKSNIIKYMMEEFITDEPLGRYGRISAAGQEVMKLFEDALIKAQKHNLGLICLTTDENDKPTIAAFNCTTLCSENEEKCADEDKNKSKILQTLEFVKDQVNPFEKFKIKEYLYALGLYVLPKYRGEGLGLALLKSREALCRACGLKASLTIFTSIISQKLAERVGFRDLYSIDYDEPEKKEPKFSYPGIQEHTKTLRFMYILYE